MAKEKDNLTKEKVFELLSELEGITSDIELTCDLHEMATQEFDDTSPSPGKEHDAYVHGGTLIRAVFDRLYDEKVALKAVFRRLWNAYIKSSEGGGDILPNLEVLPKKTLRLRGGCSARDGTTTNPQNSHQ